MIPTIGPTGRLVAVLALGAGGTACGQWQRVGSDTEPDPGIVVPRLFDPTGMYEGMGFFAQGPPIPFVAAMRYLAGPADTTLVVFGLSLANSGLSFRRGDPAFEAKYRAEVVFRRDGQIVRRVASDETVRVASFQETLRADESVIFQQFVPLVPGTYDVTVSVRDEYGGSFARDQRSAEVPTFRERRLSGLIPVYQGRARSARSSTPSFLVNPRATTPYGLDTLRFYVEGYGLRDGSFVRLTGFAPTGDTIWTERARLDGNADFSTATVSIEPDRLPVGELQVVATADGTEDTVSAPALVSFSDQWAITNFGDVLSLLRYFGQDRAIDSMQAAVPADRPALWRAFWRETDPNPVTPENEALEAYFRRVQIANARFQEAGDPGWLTDRGEVYITIGEPDEIFDQSSNLQGQRRIIRWNYIGERLQLDFVDDTGFGRFRLTPISRSEYQRVLNRIRRRN